VIAIFTASLNAGLSLSKSAIVGENEHVKDILKCSDKALKIDPKHKGALVLRKGATEILQGGD